MEWLRLPHKYLLINPLEITKSENKDKVSSGANYKEYYIGYKKQIL